MEVWKSKSLSGRPRRFREDQERSFLQRNLPAYVVEDFYTSGLNSSPRAEEDSDFIIVPQPQSRRASGKFNSLIFSLMDMHGLR